MPLTALPLPCCCLQVYTCLTVAGWFMLVAAWAMGYLVACMERRHVQWAGAVHGGAHGGVHGGAHGGEAHGGVRWAGAWEEGHAMADIKVVAV